MRRRAGHQSASTLDHNMPTGGVSPTKESLESWFNAGITCVGMGSKIIAKAPEGNFDYEKIESLVNVALEIIKRAKK